MSARRVTSSIDDLVSGRHPRKFKADQLDAEVLRTAIAIRAVRPGGAAPEAEFVDTLRKDLALEVSGVDAPAVRRVLTRRSRLLLGTAAVVTMVGGTAAATAGLDRAVAAAPATSDTYRQILRTGAFESNDGKTVGEIVAYRGDPSWVFMTVRAPGMNGTLLCQIEMDNGDVGPTGTFVMHNGVGEWSRPVSVDIAKLRGATLISSRGSALATANFSESL